ncbi:Membrane bound guanine nucleotide exchange factor [Komagataella phaffii CBS 7435]|uniref:Membrane bound guanine nucleotide exchange factor (GEF or GDP-release factor) n=2 Tax=Komagataella phaffii TaxID=460519 RepID=C4QXG3_KOMPG|nr:Membrane bound guanine nucleotide exchange factor (GEF or GDP-release factor) [Komagataella phaffii GS115]AOA60728.1 GQ67_02078T0 [Komagataella phaffii]CAH2446749.1 Membrane bound guanine nucleotide exchange factor [Komagataella phaffii CBS 7435]AOA65644.1 GQ68_02093T0 [Komagataella phaffii GS115]CAY67936.1 Membrane bound guanine nucleotide exchange factor (GEF or GDP-release factor) [Komagataella phaffii GS115]CCA37014.1 Membrane bound guanine nucleotide exchange factor [Komagataella phaff
MYDEIAPDAQFPRLIKPIDVVVVQKSFPSNSNNTLSLVEGQVVHVLNKLPSGWWDGLMVMEDSKIIRGWFPSNHVKSSLPSVDANTNRVSNNLMTATNKPHINLPKSILKNIDDFENKGNKSRHSSTVSFVSSNSLEAVSSNNTQGPKRPSIVSENSRDASSNHSGSKVFNLAELESYLEDHPTNETLTWMPVFNAKNVLLYYSEVLDICCSELPMTHQGPVGEVALPYKTSSNVIEPVEYDGSSRGPAYHQTHDFAARQDSLTNSNSSFQFRQKKRSVQFVKPDSGLLNLPGYFYSNPTDIKTWDQFLAAFTSASEATIDSLLQGSKKEFTINLMRTSLLVTLLQLITRLKQSKIAKTDSLKNVSFKLKKITSMLTQLTVNGNLHFSAFEDSPNYMGNLKDMVNKTSLTDNLEKSNSEYAHEIIDRLNEKHTTGSTLKFEPSLYLRKAEVNRAILSERVKDTIQILRQISDATFLPQIYPRFFQNGFEAANWSVYFVDPPPNIFQEELDSSPGSSVTSNTSDSTPNVLRALRTKHTRPLNERTAIDLEMISKDLNFIFQDILRSLKSETPPNCSRYKHYYDITVDVATIAHSLIPLMSKFLNYLDELDFSLFKELKRTFGDTLRTLKRSKDADQSSQGDNDYTQAKRVPKNGDSSRFEDNGTRDADSHDQTSTSEAFLVCETFFKASFGLVTEFYDSKQILFNLFSDIVLDVQSLTLDDTESFLALREDDLETLLDSPDLTTRLAARLAKRIKDREIFASSTSIHFDPLRKMPITIGNIQNRLMIIIELCSQLLEEKQILLNYTARSMIDGLNFLPTLNDSGSNIGNNQMSQASSTEEVLEGWDIHVPGSEFEPWFLSSSTREKELIYNSNKTLKGGSKDGLLDYLTSSANEDVMIRHTFLLTFKSMFREVEFVSKLIQRFNLKAPEGLSYDEYRLWLDRKLRPTQEMVLKIIIPLLRDYWNVHYYSPKLMRILDQFATSLARTSFFKEGQTIKELVKKVAKLSIDAGPDEPTNNSHLPIIHTDNPPPPPILPKSSSIRKLKLKEIHSREVARQLTIMQYRYFAKINQMELLSRCWNAKKYGSIGSSPNITKFINDCNRLTHFTSYMILRKKNDIKKRAEYIGYFIRVANECRSMRNFSTMTAIISALGSTKISRLKKTWKLVPEQEISIYQSIDALMSIERNYGEYRSILMNVSSEPCVPFLGVFLSDLRFMADGNSDYLKNVKTNKLDKKLINFEKRYRIATLVTDAQKFTQIPPNFQEVKEIQDLIERLSENCPTEDELYELSLQIEPRLTVSQVMNKSN